MYEFDYFSICIPIDCQIHTHVATDMYAYITYIHIASMSANMFAMKYIAS